MTIDVISIAQLRHDPIPKPSGKFRILLIDSAQAQSAR